MSIVPSESALELVSAIGASDRIVLVFNVPVTGGALPIPSSLLFKLKLNGQPADGVFVYGVGTSSVEPQQITLSTSTPIRAGDVLALSYTPNNQDPTGVIQSASGERLPAFTDFAVEITATDTIPPRLIGARAEGSFVTVQANESLFNDFNLAYGDFDGFTVLADGVPQQIEKVMTNPFSPTFVGIQLVSALQDQALVSIGYRGSAEDLPVDVIQDRQGNDLQDAQLSTRADSYDKTPPSLLSLSMAPWNDRNLLLSFDEDVTRWGFIDLPPLSLFSVASNGRPLAFTSGLGVGSGNIVENPEDLSLHLEQPLLEGQSIELTYTASPLGIRDISGNLTPSFQFTAILPKQQPQSQISELPLALDASSLQLLYLAYYGRPADPDGLAFWESKTSAAGFSYAPRAGDLLTGVERSLYDTIVIDFGNSVESARLYAGLTSQQAANTVYQFCFGRDAELDVVTGVNYWVDKLERKEITLSQLAAEVALGAQGADLTYIGKKLKTATAFTEALDTPLKVASYSSEQDASLARSWLNGFGYTSASPQQVEQIFEAISAVV